MSNDNRNTIFVEQARILAHDQLPEQQYVLRVNAPQCATHAKPGQFAHLQCDHRLPMRRPLSIMRVSNQEGWVEFLYKVVGDGTHALAQRTTGEQISLLGPIGKPFTLNPKRPRKLLIGGGVGIPPMIFMAQVLSNSPEDAQRTLVLMGSEVPFPFDTASTRLSVEHMPDDITAAHPALEEWNIASRLASLSGFPNCFNGHVTALARTWLASFSNDAHDEIEMFACGPEPMLQAVAGLAHDYGLPCQLSLEEYMACGVGGCAGCTVRVHTSSGPAMKRVCVDGPVFEASTLYPN